MDHGSSVSFMEAGDVAHLANTPMFVLVCASAIRLRKSAEAVEESAV